MPAEEPKKEDMVKGATVIYDDWGNRVSVLEYEYAVDRKKRKVKRIITFICTTFFLVTGCLILFLMPEGRVTALENVITMWFVMLGTILCAYFGVESFDHLGKRMR